MSYIRKTYLVNPKFQLKFSVYICILLSLSSIIYPFTIYDIMTSYIDLALSSSPELASGLIKKRQILILILVMWQIGFTSLVFIICIFFSHKIAGPLYKMIKFFRDIRNGDAPNRLFFRNGDYFEELADEFNDTFDMIQDSYRQDFMYISEINTYLTGLANFVPEDKKPMLNEINKRLTEIQERFNRI